MSRPWDVKERTVRAEMEVQVQHRSTQESPKEGSSLLHITSKEMSERTYDMSPDTIEAPRVIKSMLRGRVWGDRPSGLRGLIKTTQTLEIMSETHENILTGRTMKNHQTISTTRQESPSILTMEYSLSKEQVMMEAKNQHQPSLHSNMRTFKRIILFTFAHKWPRTNPLHSNINYESLKTHWMEVQALVLPLHLDRIRVCSNSSMEAMAI